MMHLMLKRAGVSHVMCLDGDEIVQRCTQGERFRIILMDRQMVRMGGEAATRAIRQLGVSSSITRIIGLTGDAMAEDMRTFRESGLDEARTKPLLAHEWKEIERRCVIFSFVCFIFLFCFLLLLSFVCSLFFLSPPWRLP